MIRKSVNIQQKRDTQQKSVVVGISRKSVKNQEKVDIQKSGKSEKICGSRNFQKTLIIKKNANIQKKGTFEKSEPTSKIMIIMIIMLIMIVMAITIKIKQKLYQII